MKTFLLAAITLLALLNGLVADAQPYTVPGAQVQPAWVFPIWFEDFNGDCDTIYVCYDAASSPDDLFFNPDTQFGEEPIVLDTSKFNGTAYLNSANILGWKTIVVPGLYNFYVYFTKGRMPLKVKWDRNLFYDPVLLGIPVPNLLPNSLIQINCQCSDFDMDYHNCPTGWDLIFIPEDPLGYAPNGFHTDSIIFMGDTIGPESSVGYLVLSLMFNPYHEPVGTTKVSDSKDYSIYPNPFEREITIHHHVTESARYALTNSIGRLVASGILETAHTSIDTRQLSSGIYTLALITNRNTRYYKLIKI